MFVEWGISNFIRTPIPPEEPKVPAPPELKQKEIEEHLTAALKRADELNKRNEQDPNFVKQNELLPVVEKKEEKNIMDPIHLAIKNQKAKFKNRVKIPEHEVEGSKFPLRSSYCQALFLMRP
jgi:hypothetical protein